MRDDELLQLTENRIPVVDAAIFLAGLRKMAMEDVAPEAAEPMPDPLPQLLTEMVSHKLKAQLAYLFYAAMLRGTDHGELAKFFQKLAAGDAKDIQYFLRRLSVLVPGGMPIPPAPTPIPLEDTRAILEQMIAIEQHGIVLLKSIQAAVQGDPMQYVIEQMLGDEQGHVDQLLQRLPPASPETKIAEAIRLARKKLAAPQRPAPPPGAVVVPQPGSEDIDSYLERETQLQLAQEQAEKAQLAEQVGFLQQQAEQQQLAAQNAQMESQQLQQQMAMLSDQAQMAQQQAQQATEQAAQSQEQAAQEADAKMRLGMRINQLRQQLAQIVAADPVAEEGVGFGEAAGAGQPMTPAQQEQAAAEQQAMDAEQPPTKSDSKKQPKEKAAKRT